MYSFILEGKEDYVILETMHFRLKTNEHHTRGNLFRWNFNIKYVSPYFTENINFQTLWFYSIYQYACYSWTKIIEFNYNTTDLNPWAPTSGLQVSYFFLLNYGRIEIFWTPEDSTLITKRPFLIMNLYIFLIIRTYSPISVPSLCGPGFLFGLFFFDLPSLPPITLNRLLQTALRVWGIHDDDCP